MYKCQKCRKSIKACETYEYRGAYSCEDCFDDVIAARDFQRREIIAEENAKLSPLKGMDLSPDNAIGRANREILRANIEIASKESGRLKEYEGR